MVSHLEADHPYVALHHRLDAPASGLLVVSVDRTANQGLAHQFQSRAVRRTYRAVLTGTAHSGAWDRPVDGRPAHTEVAVTASNAGLSACVLTPRTGRKHQLRVHAALAGHPICGDRRYGTETARWPRLALHACSLSFTHPITSQVLTFDSELPPDLAPLWGECIAAAG